MKYRSIILCAALLAASCVPAVQDGKKPKAAAAPAERGAPVTKRELTETYVAGKGGDYTFLDTLNRGREIALTAEELHVLEVEVVTKPVVHEPGTGFVELPVDTPPRFRIQILASGNADAVRREKLNAESKTSLPVTMSSEQSLFKLFIGDFRTRDEADAALPDIRKLGYTDAWIVTTR